MIVVKDEPRKFAITCVRHAAKCMLSPGDNFARFYRVSVRERLPSLLSLFPRYKFLWCRALIHRLAADYGARSSGARYKEHISEQTQENVYVGSLKTNMIKYGKRHSRTISFNFPFFLFLLCV